MTFTYNLGTNIGRVRLAVGDKTEVPSGSASGIRSDEEIQIFLDNNSGSWQKASIEWILSVLAEISQVREFKADWLEVDPESAMENYQKMLTNFQQWYGVSGKGNTTTMTAAWRSDSLQDEAPPTW